MLSPVYLEMNVDVLNSLQVSTPQEIPPPAWSTIPNAKVYSHDVIWYVHKHDYDDLDVGEPYKSPVFAVKHHRCYIEMYPRGDPETDGYYDSDEAPVSLYLQFEDEKYPVEGKVEFQVSSRRAEKLLGNKTYTNALGWGFRRIWKDDDTDVEYKIINCTITIVVPPHSEEPSCDGNQEMTDLLKLSGDFVSLLENERYSDVVIKIGDTELRAHKNILSARSEVFAAMFKSDMSEKRSNVIEIKDVEVEVMKHLLRYLYSGRFENVEGSVEGLMAAADKYGLQDLKRSCSKVLTEKISIFNVANLLVLADTYQDGQLIKDTFHFIKKNWSQVQESDAWKELRKVRGDLAFFVRSVVKD